ncbi:olfactory receptor 5K3-like [Thomomys bottae]
MNENNSCSTEFTLTGFTDKPSLKIILFVIFLAVYLVTMVGNLGLIALIYTERRLHTPMYIFLGNLALMDACCSCAITPKMLENFFSVEKRISLCECMVQFYFLCLAETADCFLLAAMAYDRYVAICSPLQYHSKMSKKLCILLAIGAFIAGHVDSTIHVALLFRLTFCGSHQVNHFFCDVLPLYRISSVNPYVNDLMILIMSGSIQAFSIAIVLVSYFYILFTIFTMKSKKGRGKALSTCASHFLSVSIFYGSLLFMYVRPNSVNNGNKDISVAVFYTVVIPLLNPFIYSLRNKEVTNVVRKITKRDNFITL